MKDTQDGLANPGVSVRNLGTVWADEHTHADVDLITFHEHRQHPLINLFVHDHETGEGAHAGLLPADALLLANRLTRAANAALEHDEDAPALEDELARLVAE